MRGGRHRFHLLLSAAVAAVGFSSSSARADDRFWRNPLGGSFHLDDNWSGGVPGASDSAIFDLSSVLPYTVSISSDVSNDQLRVWNDSLVLSSVPLATYTLLSTSPLAPSVIVGESVGDVAGLTLVDTTLTADGQLVVGADGSGTLNVMASSRLRADQAFIGFAGTGQISLQAGGIFESGSASIGSNASGFGFGIVEGVDSRWTNDGDLLVGEFGAGDLLVADGGLVESGAIYSGFAGDGVISVENSGRLTASSFLRMGDTTASNGTMRVMSGGRVESRFGEIGYAGGTGTAVVEGSASEWTVLDGLRVGWASGGTLTIRDAGLVGARVMGIGGDLGGDGRVQISGFNSRLEVTALLTVGGEGQGQLIVEGGGAVISGGGMIGEMSMGLNVASVSGAGSSWDMGAGELVVGADGTGRLEISSGGMVSNDSAIIGRGFGGDGAVVLEDVGTTWSSDAGVTIGLNGTGMMQISSGASAIGTSAVIGGDAASGASGSGVVVVSGNNSTWNLSGPLIVGGGGMGNLSLEHGAKVFSGLAIVGDGVGSAGIVNLIGPGTRWTTSGAVTVGNDGDGSITVGGGAQVNSSEVEVGINAVGSITVSGIGSTWISNLAGMHIGMGGRGSLLVENGGVVQSPGGVVGSGAGAIGEVIVRGGGARWQMGELLIGLIGGDGTMTIEAGGFVRSDESQIGDGFAGGSGTVIVRGAGSQWTAGEVRLAHGSPGTIDISAGGQVEAGNVGISTGSGFGLVRVKDSGSRLLVSGTVEVGRNGNATLEVSGGGEVVSNNGNVGTSPSATGVVVVSGSGAKWLMGSGDFSLGVNGAGTLNVNGGGVVSAGRGFVGAGLSGTGSATILGGSQFVLTDTLYIGGDHLGPQGSGIVTVAGGGALAAANRINVWASGTLELNNGNLATPLVDLQGGLLSGFGFMTFPVSSTNGRISTGGTLTLAGNLSIAAGSQLVKQGAGMLRIDGTQNHGPGATLHAIGGSIFINSDAGTPATAGSAALANLIVRISGSSVLLGADQELRGLNVEFANSGSQSFDLATPAVAGTFRSVRVYSANLTSAKAAIYAAMRNANAAGAANPADGIFDSGIVDHPGSKLGMARLLDLHGDPYLLLRLTRVGDLNLDGQVTISDFIDLASNFNSSGATWQEGDLNYDGVVTISDFIDLASNFNSSYSGAVRPISTADQQALASFASAHGATVPEPGATLVLSVGTALLASSRRRR